VCVRPTEYDKAVQDLKEAQDIVLGQHQARIVELGVKIEQIQTELDETAIERDKLAATLEELHRQDLPEIKTVFEREWSDNDRMLQARIEDLQEKYREAIEPDKFGGIRESAARGNAIIHYFLEQGIVLDGRWIDRGVKEDVLWLSYRDFQKTPDFLDGLNVYENLRWMEEKMGLLAEPKFSFDLERLLVSIKLVHSCKIAQTSAGDSHSTSAGDSYKVRHLILI
jgi:hypothetical protein